MRWVFPCFEGIERLHLRHGPAQTPLLILQLTPLHQQILAPLGPTYEQCDNRVTDRAECGVNSLSSKSVPNSSRSRR
jgi:hypothetical protein